MYTTLFFFYGRNKVLGINIFFITLLIYYFQNIIKINKGFFTLINLISKLVNVSKYVFLSLPSAIRRVNLKKIFFA